MDPSGSEFGSGHVVVEDQVIVAAGPGRAPEYHDGVPTERVDGSGHLLTPGLVNAHHHFYQWLTRGLAQQANLFEWLVALYPVWARIDEAMVYAAARASIASLLRSGCTTAADHHYVFPRGAGDLIGAGVRAARELGIRFHAARGSMDLGQSAGGLPPDFAVEDADAALTATEQALDSYHDRGPAAMVRVSVAPCSPFSVTAGLLSGAAELARMRGVRLHTHAAETTEEEAFCAERFGCSSAEYLDGLGWLGGELRAAVLSARARRGATALTVPQALHMATIGGARCLGRADEIGSIEPGKLADLALWRIDGPEHANIADPVAALVLGALPPLSLLLVGGKPVVTSSRLVGADEATVASQATAESRRLRER